MRVIGLLIGVLAMALGVGPSWADGSIKDAPAPAAVGCVGQFSGYYAGGQVGYQDHDLDFDLLLTDESAGADDSGVTFGIYSGYNVQCGRAVFGFESDFNSSDTDARFTDPCCDALISSEINWFSTARVRAGFVHNDNLLFYVTGGLAYADIDYTFAVGSLDFYQKDSETKFGWTIGGGAELLRSGSWSLKAEALYVDLGDKSIGYEDALCGVLCTQRTRYEDDFWTARIGFAYHFGRREEEAVPLK